MNFDMLFDSTFLIPKHLVVTIQDLKAMTDAAGTRPVIIVNPRLKVSFLHMFIYLERK